MKAWMAAICGLIWSQSLWANEAVQPSTSIHDATYISIESQGAQEKNLTLLLKQGAYMVKSTEPGTSLWFALTREGNQFAIFDAFRDTAGRSAHFNGQVAAALKQNSDKLIKDGWENGVVKNIHNATVLTSNDYQPDRLTQSRYASYIPFKAIAGKEKELEVLLQKMVIMVNRVEPNTIFWAALKNEDGSYALFDSFSDMEALKAHFSGVAAATLQQNAARLIQGGWDDGVVKNVRNYEVIATN